MNRVYAANGDRTSERSSADTKEMASSVEQTQRIRYTHTTRPRVRCALHDTACRLRAFLKKTEAPPKTAREERLEANFVSRFNNQETCDVKIQARRIMNCESYGYCLFLLFFLTPSQLSTPQLELYDRCHNIIATIIFSSR